MGKSNKKGRKSAYRKNFAKIAFQLCLLGATDAQMSAAFEVSVVTFNAWKHRYPAFLKSLKEGKEFADSEVVASLYQRAIGYSHPDTHFSTHEGEVTGTPTIKHYPPDTTAAIFWLKNRRPDLWRDVQRHEHTGKDGGPVQVEHMSAEELRRDMIARGELDAQGRLIQQN